MVAAAAAPAVRRAVAAWHPGGPQRWQRSNFRDATVDLAAGPAAVLAVVGGAVAGGAPTAASVAALGAGGLGLYDDLAGTTHARGLRGHAQALRAGVITTGMVKMVGLVVVALAAHLAAGRRGRGAVTDVVLMAGSANLVNLLDLRPGRAVKSALVLSLLAGRGTAEVATTGACAGAAVALLRDDLHERFMLGDCGANALGAALGWSLSCHARPFRTTAAAAIIALTLASEKVSFSRVIDSNAALSAIDRWGRLPT
jgi:hypothetical protein